MSYNNTTTHEIFSNSNITKVILTTYIVTLIILGVILNASLLIVVKIKSLLRKPTDLLLCSIAASNVACCLMVLPTIIITIINPDYRFSGPICEGQGAVIQTWWTSNIYSIMFYCYDQYQSISNPLESASRTSNKRTIFIIIFLWIFSVLIGWLPIFGLSSYTFSEDKCLCEKSWNDDMYINLAHTVISFWLPFIVIISCNISIINYARISMASNVALLQCMATRVNELRTRRRELFKLVKTSLFITGGILFTWFPHLLFIYISMVIPTNFMLVLFTKLTLYFSFLPILIYPYFYGLKNRRMREHLIRLYKKLYKTLRCNDVRKIHPAHEIDEDDYTENIIRRDSRSETINASRKNSINTTNKFRKNSIGPSNFFIHVKNRQDSTGSTNLTPVDI